MTLGAQQYQCEWCKGIYTKGQPDEQAASEVEEVFGVSTEDCALVCDDCYTRFMSDRAKPVN